VRTLRGELAVSLKALASPSLDAAQRRRSRAIRRWRTPLLLAACALAALGAVTGICAAQLIFRRCQLDEDLGTCPARLRDAVTDVLKAFTTASTAALVLVLLAVGAFDAEDLRLSGELLPHESVLATPVPFNTLVCVLFCGLHCPAGVYSTTRVASPTTGDLTYDYDSLLSIALALRFIFMLPIVVDEFAGLRSAASRVIERFQGVTFSLTYVLRLMMERAPLEMSVAAFVALVLSTAYAVHVVERPVCQSPAALAAGYCGAPGALTSPDFSYFGNCIWFSVVTATTVGYGDIIPVTNAGRCVAAATTIFGTMTLAFLIGAVQRTTTLSPAEARSMRAFSRLRRTDEKVAVAEAVVGRFLALAAKRLPGVAPAAGAEDSASAAASALPQMSRAARRAAAIARLRPLADVAPARHNALASAVNRWRAQIRSARRATGDVDDVALAHYDVLDMRETMGKLFDRLEARLSQRLAKLEAAVDAAAAQATAAEKRWV